MYHRNRFGINKSASAEPIVLSSHLQALQEAIDSLLVRIRVLEGENRALKSKLEGLERDQTTLSENQLIQLRLINELRKRPESTEFPLIDELYVHMKNVGLKQTTFAGAAKILGVTKMRVFQLKASIAIDERFNIIALRHICHVLSLIGHRIRINVAESIEYRDR